MKDKARMWWLWLIVVSAGVAFFGLVMVVAPEFTRTFFGLLIFASSDAIDNFGGPAVAYISLTHGVLGTVMLGWGVVFLFVLLGPFRRGSREAWFTIAVSLTAWYVTDTIFSLWSGFWPNAVLNTVFAVLFAVPLAATYRDLVGRQA